jgi:hypothetical protein
MKKKTILLVAFLLSTLLGTGTASASTWTPTPGAQWQLVLSGTPDTSLNVSTFDIDGFDNPASTVATIHSKGAGAVCYIDVGTWENWRSDASSFPASVKGSNVAGWAGEKWLDVRNWTVLGPIMTKRFQMCVDKGFDAVEPDNVDGYANSSGFPLTASQQITYNQNIAALAHSLGLKVALKNDVDQLSALQPYFDWALNEECARYNECSGYSVFKNAGKAIWNVEYQAAKFPAFCAKTYPLFGSASMLRNLDLTPGGTRKPCTSA